MRYNGKGFSLANNEEITIKMEDNQIVIESSLSDNTDYGRSIDEQLNNLFNNDINPTK